MQGDKSVVGLDDFVSVSILSFLTEAFIWIDTANKIPNMFVLSSFTQLIGTHRNSDGGVFTWSGCPGLEYFISKMGETGVSSGISAGLCGVGRCPSSGHPVMTKGSF